MVCRCLQIRERALMSAFADQSLDTVTDVIAYTSAGGGCTACHVLIKQYLAWHANGLPGGRANAAIEATQSIPQVGECNSVAPG